MSIHRTLLCASFIAFTTALLAGCQEPNYRNEITGTGQGGIEIHRAPKDDPAPALTARAAPAPNTPAAQPDPTTEQRTAALEEQVRKLNAEIERLKREKAAPTTAP